MKGEASGAERLRIEAEDTGCAETAEETTVADVVEKWGGVHFALAASGGC